MSGSLSDEAYPNEEEPYEEEKEEEAAHLADISLQCDADSVQEEAEADDYYEGDHENERDDNGHDEYEGDYEENVENVPPPPQLMG